MSSEMRGAFLPTTRKNYLIGAESWKKRRGLPGISGEPGESGFSPGGWKGCDRAAV